MNDNLTFVNTPMDAETLSMLEAMAKEDGYKERAPFMRRLIRQEYTRRYVSQPLAISEQAKEIEGS